jgi:hypothetical protein
LNKIPDLYKEELKESYEKLKEEKDNIVSVTLLKHLNKKYRDYLE